jgi:hypothetical protein
MNNIINNKPTQVIEVYDMSFNFLWSFTIPDQVFCHDIVFQGHTAYFLAPPNKLCSLDIVTKQSKVNATFNISSMHPRGLSIDEYGNTVIGFRNENAIAVCDINMINDTHPLTTIPAPCAPCFIAKVDYDMDYNNPSSKLVNPYVMQIPISGLPIDNNPLDAIVKSILDNDTVWSQCHDTRASFQQGANFFSIPTDIEYPISQVKDPPPFLFEDIRTLQQVTSHKVHISNLTKFSIPSHLQDVYTDIMAKMSEYKEKVKERVLHVSGDLYLYPPNSALGWHTNLEEPSNYDTCRCYLIFTNKDNESIFLYRHPISHQIHAVPDRSNYANIFDLGKPSSPLWHAVYNNSTEMSRLSVGIAFHKHRMGTFSKLMNDIQKIHH